MRMSKQNKKKLKRVWLTSRSWSFTVLPPTHTSAAPAAQAPSPARSALSGPRGGGSARRALRPDARAQPARMDLKGDSSPDRTAIAGASLPAFHKLLPLPPPVLLKQMVPFHSSREPRRPISESKLESRCFLFNKPRITDPAQPREKARSRISP